jgi:hypothetical protein
MATLEARKARSPLYAGFFLADWAFGLAAFGFGLCGSGGVASMRCNTASIFEDSLLRSLIATP